MDTFSDLIDALGGASAFGDGISVPASHARTMKAHNSIPPEYWPATMAVASVKGVDGVTFQALLRMRAARTPARAREASAA